MVAITPKSPRAHVCPDKLLPPVRIERGNLNSRSVVERLARKAK